MAGTYGAAGTTYGSGTYGTLDAPGAGPPDTLTNTCSISRAAPLPTSPLEVDDGTTYELFAWSPGPRQWKHKVIESDFLNGELRHNSKLTEASRILGVRVKGASVSAISDAADALIDALSQLSYTVSGTINGKAFEWDYCGPAEMAYVPRLPADNGGISPDDLLAGQIDLLFTIPGRPTRGAGGFW